MKNEIERKFFIKELPDLSAREKIEYERYFLYNADGIKLRVQRKGERFELERKINVSEVERSREKIDVSEEEFALLKSLAKQVIIRDSYIVNDSPSITIKIYHEKFEGLMRAEVEFDSAQELENFVPLAWFGTEITASPLARDADLLKLSEEKFLSLLAQG
ncbi:MAG TPA: hypothetical protein VGE59_00945 [Patescibacteria group bacterium]